ncbi:MAG: STAS domain-containing protein, partial [Acidobacteria bacterium]|nr:STAS domain-containing protein [Acidobacteriota bacterium]
MNVVSRTVDSVTILDLSGRITMGEACVELRNRIRELAQSGHKNILLNLGDVSYVDSSGI